MSVLKDFFDGKVQPYHNLNVYDPDFKAITLQIDDEKENWLKKYPSDDTRKSIEKLEDLYLEYYALGQEKSFIYSFKLGVLLMLEILTGNDDMFKGGGD